MIHRHLYTGDFSGISIPTQCTNSTASDSTILLPELSGFGDDYFNDRFYLQIIKAGGAAPEGEVRNITDYVSATGTFTTDAFSTDVETGDEAIVLHESVVAIGRDDADNVYSSTNVVSNGDGSILERLEWIQTALGGAAIQLRTEQSASTTVEENGIMQFNISLMDIDSGAVTAANIDITAISQSLEISRGGAAFTAVGVTQPTFAKADGRVYCAYQFLAADWQVGDIYKMTVSGITATVGGDTAYVPMMVWSNMVVEDQDVKATVDDIDADLGEPDDAATSTLHGKIGTDTEMADYSLFDMLAGAGIKTFPAAANPANDVSIAEVIRAIVTSLVGGDDYDGYTNISNSANASINAIAQKFAATLGIDGANTFSTTIQGANQTTVEAAIDALATYIVGAGAAWSAKVNNSGSALTNLYDALNAFFAVVGIDDTNEWSTALNGATQTTIEATEAAIGANTDILYSVAVNGSKVPVANTLSDILHKDGSYTYDNTTDSLEAISDSVTTGTYSITADSGTAFTVVDATYGAYGDDYFNGSLLVCTSGTNVGQARPVIDFATTSGTFTASPAFDGAVTADDTFLLISGWKMPEWVPVAATAINATAVVSPGVDLLDLVDTDNHETYRLNNLRIKCADPGANTVTITLYELINDVSTAVDTFTITTDNYGSYFSLFDMFGLTHVSGDDITVNATTSAGSYAITGNYQYDVAYN